MCLNRRFGGGETGSDSEADDTDGEQAGEEGIAGNVQADPGVHGRPQDRPRRARVDSAVRRRGEGMERRRAARRDFHSDLPSDHEKPTRVRSPFHRGKDICASKFYNTFPLCIHIM